MVHYLSSMDGFATFVCAYCGEENEVFIEPEAGAKQVLTEDCSVCCRPNVLTVTVIEDEVFIQTELEG